MKTDAGFELSGESLKYASYLLGILAIVFDVGYFNAVDINFFTLFSLTEHILFSIEAIPIAFVILIWFLFIRWACLFIIERAAKNPSRLISNSTRLRIALYALAVLPVVPLTILISMIDRHQNYPMILIVITTIATGTLSALLNIESAMRRMPSNHYLAAFAALCMVCAFAFGVAIATAYVNGPTSASHKMQLKSDGVKSVLLIRSGERGVLFFDVESRLVQFRKWDDIERISGDHGGIRRR